MLDRDKESYRRVIVRRADALIKRIEFLRLHGDTRDMLRGCDVKR